MNVNEDQDIGEYLKRYTEEKLKKSLTDVDGKTPGLQYGILLERDRDSRITTMYYTSITPTLYKILEGIEKHEQKPYLDVHENLDNYLEDWFWAFTIPSERKIIMWSSGKRDYRLHVLDHEIEHNVDPSASEYTTDVRANMPSRGYARDRYALRRR